MDSYAIGAAGELRQREGGTLGEALCRLGLLDEEKLVAVFQQGLLVPRVASAVLLRVPRVVLGLVPPHLAVAHRIIPVELDSEGSLTLAMADPADNRAVDEIASLTQRFVLRAVAAPSAIREALLVHYRTAAMAAGIQAVVTPSAGPSAWPVVPGPPSGHTPAAPPSSASASSATRRPSSAPAAPVTRPSSAPAAPTAPRQGSRSPTTMGAVAFQPLESRPTVPLPIATVAPQSGTPTVQVPAAVQAVVVPAAVAHPAGRVPSARVSGGHGAVSGRGRRGSLPSAELVVPDAALPVGRGVESLLALSRAFDATPEVATTKAKRPRSGRNSGGQAQVTGATSGERPRSGRNSGKAAAAPAAPAKPARVIDPSLQAPVTRLQAAQTRDEVVNVLLDYASQLAARVGLFVVQQGQLTCLDGRGPDHVVVAMKWFTIPVDTPSPFRDVLQSRKAYMGSLEDSAESRAFRNALGSSPGELLLLPLLVGEKVVGVLYADELKADLQRLSRELETLSQEAGAAFARIILSRKKKS